MEGRGEEICKEVSGNPNFGDVRLIIMRLEIASQAHPDVSGFDRIIAEERRFGKPPGKHPVEDKSPIDECVTGRRGTKAA